MRAANEISFFRTLGYCLPVALAAVAMGAAGLNAPLVLGKEELGSIVPWNPYAIDLAVYRRAGAQLLAGQNFYQTAPGELPFIYPPFAALVAVPLAGISWGLIVIFWPLFNAALLLLLGYRFGLRGWALSICMTLVILLVEPVRITLGFGQINVVLMCLVMLDSLPGKRWASERRLLPEGVLTGFATAIKLTPGAFTLHQALAGRWRVAIVSGATFAVTVIIGWVLLPDANWEYWTRLAAGDSGMNPQLPYYTNQSVMASAIRFFGESAARPALVVSALAGLLGIAAGACWQRLGQVSFALSITGFAALVASPISWSHHYVWVVPLGLALYFGRDLPRQLRILGWVLVGYVALAPYKFLADGGWQRVEQALNSLLGVPLSQTGGAWPLWALLLNSTGLVIALAFLVMAQVVGYRKLQEKKREKLLTNG